MGEAIDSHIELIEDQILKATSSLDDCCRILRHYSSWDEYLKKQYGPQFEVISNTIYEKLEELNPQTLSSKQYEEECQKLKKLHEERNEELLNRLTREILSQFLSSSSD